MPRSRWVTVAAFAAVAVAGGLSAYFQLFSQFAYYDDEGYVLTSISEFAAGGTLYSDVYSQYGPFYYELFGGFFAATGLDVTNNAGRLIVLAIWIVCATGYGVLALTITRSLAIGLATQAVAFAALAAVVPEPMHPVALTCLMTLGVLALVARQPTPRTLLTLGALLAALALVKINVGVLAALGVVATAALTLGGHSRALRISVYTALALVTLGLLASNIGQLWVFELLIVELAVIAAVLVQMHGLPGRESPGQLGRWLKWVATGAALAGTVIVAIILVLGASLGDVIDAVLLAPRNQARVLILKYPLPYAAVGWAMLSLAAAVLVTRFGGLRWARSQNWLLTSALVRIAAALMTWFSITAVPVLPINSPAPGTLVLALLLSWLMVKPPSQLKDETGSPLTRPAIALVAVLGVLQGYPVAGSQVLASTVPFALIGAIEASDGLRLLKLWAATGKRAERIGQTVLTATIVVLALVVVFAIERPLTESRGDYRDGVQPSLRGASLLRIDRQQADAYERLVARLRKCDTFVAAPGFSSLYIWTGKRPPTGQNATSWFLLWDTERQQKVVDALARRPGPICVVRNPKAEGFALGASKFGQIPQRPLYQLVSSSDLREVLRVNDGKIGGETLVLERPR